MSPIGSRRPRRLRDRAIELALRSEAETGAAIVADVESDELHWVDTDRGEIHRLDPGSRADVVVARVEPPIAFALPQRGEGWIVGLTRGMGVLDGSGRAHTVVGLPGLSDTHRPAHAVCDSAGRVWIGTTEPGAERGGGALFRMGGDLVPVRHLDGVARCCGIACNADGTRLFHAEGATQTVVSHALDPESGALSDRQVVVDLAATGAVPHGIAIDIAGCVWVALYDRGEVHRYSAIGRLDTVVELPVSRPTGVAFAGADASTLFITSAWHGLDVKQRRRQLLAGSVFAVDVGIAGVATPRFG